MKNLSYLISKNLMSENSIWGKDIKLDILIIPIIIKRDHLIHINNSSNSSIINKWWWIALQCFSNISKWWQLIIILKWCNNNNLNCSNNSSSINNNSNKWGCQWRGCSNLITNNSLLKFYFFIDLLIRLNKHNFNNSSNWLKNRKKR